MAQWYHAVDIPKRKPFAQSSTEEEAKPTQAPKKYIPFAEGDSRAIEAAFQKLVDKDDERGRSRLRQSGSYEDSREVDAGAKHEPNISLEDTPNDAEAILVPVNEDYLFDVDVEKRELGPAYWLGPVYDVRRGTWFYAENAGLRPCDENLATQLEEGYLKTRPWTYPTVSSRSGSQTPRGRASSLRRPDQRGISAKPEASEDVSKSKDTQMDQPVVPQPPSRSFRLFGAHMNSVVTYEDSTTAYIVGDSYLTAMSGTLYERFSGGAHLAGTKVVRGYTEQTKTATGPEEKRTESPKPSFPAKVNEDSIPSSKDNEDGTESEKSQKAKKETPRQALERQFSNLVGRYNPQQEEEEVRKRDEAEMREDYQGNDTIQAGRDIEHLILVTHGIGQRLGLRLESVNFIHDVNTLRKVLKSVYNESPDLQALNGEDEKETKNCRIQVLPISWRHLLDFPKQSLKHNRIEHDIGDGEGIQDAEYPSLEDITIEGVPAIRNLITDLGLDILLYQSPIYKPHITKIVLEECNRIYRLFKSRNPSFKGKISLIGHSLGSAIMFDILCNQKIEPSSPYLSRNKKADPRIQLDFDVADFYAFGSPVGLFQMLKGRTIAARQSPNVKPAQTPFGQIMDPFSQNSAYLEITTSSPKCRQIFNIFHPTDPIAYRLEPLISPAMANMSPQPLPYTKKGIFGAPAGQGLTNIGARVGQSMSGLWSSFSSGIASSLINRTLGLSNEEANRLGNPLSYSLSSAASAKPPVSDKPSSERPSSSAQSAGESNTAPLSVEDAKRLVAQGSKALETGEDGENPPTLLNTGLETLFDGFQQQQEHATKAGTPLNGPATREERERLKREEEKMRALNKNGRVDYSIQEYVYCLYCLTFN
jgi:DDHD domain-containing protein